MATVTCQPGAWASHAPIRVSCSEAEQLRVVELLGELGGEQPDAADAGLRVTGHVVQHAEQGEEDRHLHEQGKTR
jgi:hypothetical protein